MDPSYSTMKKPLVSPLKRPSQDKNNYAVITKKPHMEPLKTGRINNNVLQSRQMLPVYKVRRR